MPCVACLEKNSVPSLVLVDMIAATSFADNDWMAFFSAGEKSSYPAGITPALVNAVRLSAVFDFALVERFAGAFLAAVFFAMVGLLLLDLVAAIRMML